MSDRWHKYGRVSRRSSGSLSFPCLYIRISTVLTITTYEAIDWDQNTITQWFWIAQHVEIEAFQYKTV